jgi:hypothetical protein
VQWAALVCRIRAYPGAKDNTIISAIYHHRKNHHITSEHNTDALQNGITIFGSKKLRIAPHKPGMHSICSGATMAMYLGGCPIFAIQIISRWSSDAFKKYITS